MGNGKPTLASPRKMKTNSMELMYKMELWHEVDLAPYSGVLVKTVITTDVQLAKVWERVKAK